MQRCQAAIFPSRDDFGLVPVEVMATGRPVLAYAGGGARYTVVPGKTGELFPDQTVDTIEAAVRDFDASRYEPAAIREHALQWDKPRFREKLVGAVARALEGDPIGDRRLLERRRPIPPPDAASRERRARNERRRRGRNAQG
jgi:glycosyltransferase involved in cell wall biosynthesis